MLFCSVIWFNRGEVLINIVRRKSVGEYVTRSTEHVKKAKRLFMCSMKTVEPDMQQLLLVLFIYFAVNIRCNF